MKIVAVLGHLMSNEGILSVESVHRLECGREVQERRGLDFILTLGWAYNPAIPRAISDVMAEYLADALEVSNEKLLSLPFSRDTVGDIYFVRRFCEINFVEKVFIVTSDYHGDRVRIIAEKFLTCEFEILTIRSQSCGFSGSNSLACRKRSEDGSRLIFESMFPRVKYLNARDIIKIMRMSHPYYNGDVHPKISTFRPSQLSVNAVRWHRATSKED